MTTKAKVLIVDDEVDNLNALKRLLRNHFDVTVAENGQDALNIVQEQPEFDVFVSDQRMPGMTGSEFFEKVQSIAPKPTRILLTGFADLEAVIEAINKGHIWRYLSKPWEPEDLIQTLRQAAERTQMGRSLDKSKKELERALTELRAKDWARERLLLILLHEFRTAPQIVENLKALNSNDEAENVTLRKQFLENLERRFQLMEEDIHLLMEDEKKLQRLKRESISLIEVLEKITTQQKHAFSHSISTPENALILSNKEMLEKSLSHFIELMNNNSQGSAPKVELDDGPSHIYITLSLSSDKSLLPKGLEKMSLHPELAWTAMLEPFVGVEDFQHHSTGLRVETARWVRFLNSQGCRPEFQISGTANKVNLTFSFPKGQ